MSSEIDNDRRRWLGTAAMTLAAARFGVLRPVNSLLTATRVADPPVTTQRTTRAFGPLKQIDAGLLNIGYAEAGPTNGAPVILLHGWPYDIHSFVEVSPLLAARGFRVIVPHLRGHGTTRFRSADTVRNGQQSVVALDVIALMDALGIDRAVLAGYDWGARTANIIGALWPERCSGMVSVNGYLINNLERNKQPLPPKVEHGWWYQFYFTTERGREGYNANRREFARLIWQNNSPTWAFSDAQFDQAAASFDNPDHVGIVIHNYRWRLSVADGEPQYAELERRLASGPVITVPAITLDGDSDGVAPASDGSSYAAKFPNRRAHRIIKGAGHNLPQEAPQAFADAVIEVAGMQ